MKMRRMAVAALAITGVGLIPAPAKAQNTQDLIETVGAMILADRLGIDPNMVLMAKLTTGSSVYDLAPALAMGAFGNADPYQIYGMQSAGMGWNQIAGYSRVPQPVYSTLVRTRQLEPDVIWADEFSDRYGVGQDKLYALRRAGYNWHEIAQAMVESQETGQPVEEALYENRMFGMNVEPVYYPNGFEPVYVPPRTTVRYVSVLPAPRTDWRFMPSVFEPTRVLWVNNSTSWRRTVSANTLFSWRSAGCSIKASLPRFGVRAIPANWSQSGKWRAGGWMRTQSPRSIGSCASR